MPERPEIPVVHAKLHIARAEKVVFEAVADT
jgi:hypothetical protein